MSKQYTQTSHIFVWILILEEVIKYTHDEVQLFPIQQSYIWKVNLFYHLSLANRLEIQTFLIERMRKKNANIS